MKSPYAAVPFWIGFFLYSVYLLSFSGKFHVMDELAVFTAGNNLAQYGQADINQLIWTNHWTPNPPGIWGNDGHLYTKKAPGISFIVAPLIWLGHTLPGLNAVHLGLLANTLVTALTASLLCIWLTDFGFSRSTTILTALGYGLCTIAWVYARLFWESSLLALSFLVAVWAIYRATHPAYIRRRWAWTLLCGIAVAIGLTLRFENVPAIVFIGLYLLVSKFFPFSWRSLGLYLLPAFLIGLWLLYFNFVRYGAFSETGYTQEILFQAPWVGGFGLLFSPGRGLFIYASFMLLLFFGLRPAWHRLPRPYFWLIVALCLFYWLFYGSWFAWGGTWGWGPRFLLPIIPLLMLFVAEPLEWATGQVGKSIKLPLTPHALRLTLAWLGITLLVILSLIINILGIVVDFNEHFLRLGRNDNFVFNWATFPPLAHWHILQEGLVDLIWLRPHPDGVAIEWSVLIPALILFVWATAGLVVVIRNPQGRCRVFEIRNKKSEKPTPHTLHLTPHVSRPMPHVSRPTPYALCLIFHPLSVIPLTLILTYLMMTATARVDLMDEQTQADLSVLETLTAAQPGDALLIPMPPFGDVQEISTRVMAYLDRPLPTSIWIESAPRAIQPSEREQVLQATMADAKRVWLFERWLTQQDATGITAARLNQEAFPVLEQWFTQSGKLTLYALTSDLHPTPLTPLNIPFQGGLTLVDFALFNHTIAPGETLKLRLTWQATEKHALAVQDIPPASIIVFIQLLDTDLATQNIAQNDRLLIDLQNLEQSPLLPGRTVQQGYGLHLPGDLPPGSYPLVVGLYRATDGQRLLRTDGSPDDFLYLTNITVE